MFSASRARRRRWGRSVVFVAAVTVLPLSGCSFVFFDRPSQYRSHEKTTCTTSAALPTLDVSLALFHLVSLAVLASASGDAYGGEKSRNALAQIDVSWLIIHGASAGWGFSWASECKELVGDEAGFRTTPMRVAPRPRPRPIPPPANESSPQPAQPTLPVPPAQAEPAAAPEAPAPQTPRVPQRIDNE
jgi:hypothetical protein